MEGIKFAHFSYDISPGWEPFLSRNHLTELTSSPGSLDLPIPDPEEFLTGIRLEQNLVKIYKQTLGGGGGGGGGKKKKGK